MSIPPVRSPACSTRCCRFEETAFAAFSEGHSPLTDVSFECSHQNTCGSCCRFDFIPSLLFSSAGIISSDQIHLYLALFHRRDYFFRPDSSPARFVLPQGLFLPIRFIPSLLFSSAGMISSGQMHPQLAFFLRRDYFDRTNASPACFFLPQGLFLPPRCIPSLLFSSAGISAQAINPSQPRPAQCLPQP